MSAVELFFLNIGLSYTLSKVMAYLLFPLIGFVIWLIIRKRIKRKGISVITLAVLCLGFFFAYFIQYPIYEGDFSNNSKPVEVKSELDQIKENKLVVISIPNCPFCQQSIGRMLDFQRRHPKVKIEYRVCVNDSLAEQAVNYYSELAKNKIPITQAKAGKQLAGIADMSFPTFVLITKSKKVKWSNDNFGAGALDEVVSVFE